MHCSLSVALVVGFVFRAPNCKMRRRHRRRRFEKEEQRDRKPISLPGIGLVPEGRRGEEEGRAELVRRMAHLKVNRQ